MKKRTKQVCAIIAAQTVCVGVGLWMQYRYTVTTVAYAATERCYEDLTSDGASVLDQLGTTGLTTVSDGSSGAYQLARALDPVNLRHGRVIITDEDWLIRYAANDKHDAIAAGSIVWQPTSIEPLRETSWSRGRFTLENLERIAVARPLPGNAGYLLITRDSGDIGNATATLVESLPAISALTMGWMFVLLSISTYMLWARVHEDMDEQKSRTASQSHRNVQDLVRTRDAVIFGLAKLADSRDPETGEHLERISVYSTLLATAAARDPKFQSAITPAIIRLIGISSALHDIGKVGVEDSILKKPGRLTKEEFRVMQDHANIGGDCLREIEQRLASSNFLQLAREIAYAHHENWDGSGYPGGLADTNIPLAARIVAIADVYDALSSKRVYKDAFPHEECVKIVRADAGKKFDPELVRVWLTIESKFNTIARQFGSERPSGGLVKPLNLATIESDKESKLQVVTSGASKEPGRL